jgi:hypothetical protein
MIRGTAKMSLRASFHMIGPFEEKYLCQMIGFCPKQGLIALQLDLEITINNQTVVRCPSDLTRFCWL